ncbi:nucleolar RNA-binding Nop10p family protein [Methanolapillus millepedarum]|uniref:nucleolar RNA-binding Nop10p family protein n=1 Tax=Methanolapillus millepedarum TaxID=3028296 RepID=UPI0030B8D2CE
MIVLGKKILKCFNCGRYTLLTGCPDCGFVCQSPKPATYSSNDRYGKYRRLYRAYQRNRKEDVNR